MAAVTGGEHLRVQNRQRRYLVSEQRGIAQEFIRVNSTATRDLLPDNLQQHRPQHIGHWSGVHTPAAASEGKTVRIYRAQLGPTDG